MTRHVTSADNSRLSAKLGTGEISIGKNKSEKKTEEKIYGQYQKGSEAIYSEQQSTRGTQSNDEKSSIQSRHWQPTTEDERDRQEEFNPLKGRDVNWLHLAIQI